MTLNLAREPVAARRSRTVDASPEQSAFRPTPPFVVSQANEGRFSMRSVLLSSAIATALAISGTSVTHAVDARGTRRSQTVDEVIVTATRAAQGVSANTIGSSVTVLHATDLEQRQTRIVSDILRATYFDNTLRDEVFTVFTPPLFFASPDNRPTQSKQRGLELYLAAQIAAAWTVDVSYIDLDATENGREEVRRPSAIGSLNVGWRAPEDRFGINLTVRYNGDTLDDNFTGVGANPIRLAEFTLVNLGAHYHINDMVQVYGRVENLLDEEYEEVYTYASAGRAGFLGGRLTF